jgi:hypothetical protein
MMLWEVITIPCLSGEIFHCHMKKIPSGSLMNIADWATFKPLCEEEIQPEIVEKYDPIASFTDHFCNIAESTIPKSFAKPTQINKSWFNEECKEVTKMHANLRETPQPKKHGYTYNGACLCMLSYQEE